ncbi:MAG: hypothetical protein J0I80_07795 [Sphingomonas sp.]|nr:hypothetical protein [Sphingomonas sp.]
MALQVIGAGLGRTGTLSLKLALEHLGFGPCHHMSEVIANVRQQLPYWLDVVAGHPDWDGAFAGYAAAVDYPGAYFWRDLAAHYPEAKIILTLRDPESWFKSVSETIFSPGHTAMFAGTPLGPFMDGTVLKDFGDRIGDQAFMIDYFNRWNEGVRSSIPPERLLLFQSRDGWVPLCAFLGVPVPDAPYPRVNSRDEMQALREDRAPPAGPEDLEAMGRGYLAAAKASAFGTEGATT